MSRIILDSEAKTDDDIGKIPDMRTVEERLESGFILLDKAAGPSSHQVASWARDMFGLERLGHGGTLDPFATGVLPLMAGKSMKLTKKILTHDKTYICVFRFASEPDSKMLEEVMSNMTGRVFNVPPEISAVKIQVRSRRIFKFEKIDFKNNQMVARVQCEAGTYIRTMARDMGLLLNMKVELKELRRETSGIFTLDDCVTLQQLADAYWLWKELSQPEALLRIIHPIEKLLLDYPSVTVKDSAAAALSHGAPLLRPGIVSIDPAISDGRDIVVNTMKGETVGIVNMIVTSDSVKDMESGEIARPSMVLLNQDLYPRRWKKSE
ncbi:MAG: RNA-guided pseudouridylation complex pseudouridine synthase subunit Cbf5 [Candidatus Poseidoniaceae archaeon]|nr:RNA-guided pseudouridylation complex pseudouridine synthase subunit Cbf5 [Candidatus Poseidoniaceae archaeon]